MAMPEKPKMLIIEDDVELATTIELAFQDPGIQIIKCCDGAEAIEVFEARRPQIVILDLMLPKRGGFYVLNRWKGHSIHKGKLPIVIIITGIEGKRHQDFAQSLGADEYLRKPFALSCLVELVSKYLNELPYLTWVDKYK